MKIGVLADMVELPAHTLRFYEDFGLLPPVPRANGQRDYPADFVPIIRFIQLARQTGFALEEIKTFMPLLDANRTMADPFLKSTIAQKISELDTVIQQYMSIRQALAELLACDEPLNLTTLGCTA